METTLAIVATAIVAIVAIIWKPGLTVLYVELFTSLVELIIIIL